jgi:arsenate reductase
MGAMREILEVDYDGIVDELAYRYSDSFSRDEIQAEVASVRADLEPKARHREFLTMLVTKQVRDRLAAKARERGTQFHVVRTILYVCVHNAARSQFAAALTEQLAGEHVHVRAAGLYPSDGVNPLVNQVLQERGITLKGAFPTGEPWNVIDAADVVVQMGAELPQFAARWVVNWNIEDPAARDLETVRRICDEIETRVRQLLTDMEIPLTDQP